MRSLNWITLVWLLNFSGVWSAVLSEDGLHCKTLDLFLIALILHQPRPGICWICALTRHNSVCQLRIHGGACVALASHLNGESLVPHCRVQSHLGQVNLWKYTLSSAPKPLQCWIGKCNTISRAESNWMGWETDFPDSTYCESREEQI